MMNKSTSYSMLIKLFVLQCLAVVALCKSKGADFDFFYFVQQWPGAYCDTKGHHCCYPKSGKPAADFGIHGLWPNYADGSYPSNCDPSNPFDESEIQDLEDRLTAEWPSLSCPSSDGMSFWTHERNKHGTCSESVLDERGYFQAALDLKDQTNLLKALNDAGIEPNDEFYNLEDAKQAIQAGVGSEPWIECNHDAHGNSQLYQVYLCVDTTGKNLIECPVRPRGNCASRIQFPSF
ncbi:Ribonuclease pancreatic beta-type [Ancistrocladus abbreviatus]